MSLNLNDPIDISVAEEEEDDAQSNSPVTCIFPVDSVYDMLECPVCTNAMFPPIHQCPNGHTLCSNCKIRVHNRCPTCRQELGDIRCLALEKMAESLELPCVYFSMGCQEVLPYYSKLEHEVQCKFRPYNCPYAVAECSVVGDISALLTHLTNDHGSDIHIGQTVNQRYVKANPLQFDHALWMVTIFYCFDRYFCLHFEAFLLGFAPVYMAFLRFMGDEDEVSNYRYRLEVAANGRKILWEGTPRSMRDSHQEVRDNQDGLIIHSNMSLLLSGGDNDNLELTVRGQIWQVEHNPGCEMCTPK